MMTPRAQGHEIVAPTPRMILESLARYVDEDEVEQLWTLACRQAGFSELRLPRTANELLPVVDALETLSDLAAVCAKGLRIRIMSYIVLSRSAGVPAESAAVGV